MDLGLFQRDVAELVGADALSVVNWELGMSEPATRFLPAILTFLGYDPRPRPATVGKRLIHYRTGKGWARPALARALGVDPSTLARWETGRKLPWGPYQARVAALLDSPLRS